MHVSSILKGNSLDHDFFSIFSPSGSFRIGTADISIFGCQSVGFMVDIHGMISILKEKSQIRIGLIKQRRFFFKSRASGSLFALSFSFPQVNHSVMSEASVVNVQKPENLSVFFSFWASRSVFIKGKLFVRKT